MNITDCLRLTLANNASDLHLTSHLPPMIRIDGEIFPLNDVVLGNDTVVKLLHDIMSDDFRKEFEEQLEVDFSFHLENVGRFRVNAFHQHYGAAAVFRCIPETVPTLGQVQAPDIFKELIKNHRGIILVTGPTGSGKSTSLAAMINEINQTRAAHIITVEDPIEYVHPIKKSIINQREVHRNTLSFKAALRSVLREDPDIILVGEMRDLDTIRLALTAAETGHLVLSTLHTASATKTTDRIIDVFPAGEKDIVRSMLSESLIGVVAQTLMKKIGGGRVPAHEIMICNSAIRNLIREDKVVQIYSSMQTGANVGMQTLDQALTKLVNKGQIEKSVAREKAVNKDLFV